MDSSKMTKRVGKFSAATLLSRILGYVRDAAVAYVFGAGALTDSFYTAFRVSNLLRRLFGEGAMASSFVPIFSESLKTQSKEQTQEFLSSMFSFLIWTLTTITLLGMIFAPQLTKIVAPGFALNPEQFERTVTLTRWTFPFFLFICLAALMSSVLNSLKHFFWPALAPAMLSISEIFYLFALLPLLLYFVPGADSNLQMLGLALSAVIGGAAHFLVQVPQLYSSGFKLSFTKKIFHPQSLRVLTLMIPAMIGLSVDQINAFVDTICATLLQSGSVSALYNSNRLMQFPLALFGVAISSVSLTVLSDYKAQERYQDCAASVNQSLRMIVVTVLPSSVGLMLLAKPICALLFERGRFDAQATIMTAQTLAAYTAGLLAYSMVKSLANAFYAFQEPKIPVKIASVCLLLNVVLNLILMRYIKVAGLALATAISSWVNAIVLYVLLRKKFLSLNTSPIETAGSVSLIDTFLKTSAASLVMAAFLGLILKLNWNTFLTVPVGILGGSVLFLVSAKLLKLHELNSLLNSLMRKN